MKNPEMSFTFWIRGELFYFVVLCILYCIFLQRVSKDDTITLSIQSRKNFDFEMADKTSAVNRF